MDGEGMSPGNNGEKIKRQRRLKQAIKLVEDGILKLLILKEDHGLEDDKEISRTKRVVDTTETVLNTVKNILEARNSDIFREELGQKIQELSLSNLSINSTNIEQIEDCLSFVTEEKSGKMQRQLYSDLKRMDARVLWYIEKFSDFGVVFESEETTFQELKLLCDWDSYLESWLQQQLFTIVKEYKAQKKEKIATIINSLQHKQD